MIRGRPIEVWRSARVGREPPPRGPGVPQDSSAEAEGS
jgi:hypothetical protein